MKHNSRRLYFDDPYRTEFESDVLRKTEHGQKPALVLEQTCFYPESGGQPADTGTINGIDVLAVVEEKNEILHVLDREVEAERVKGRIDWAARFDHMQQHAGQHILSQVFVELHQAKTLSFHLGKETSTVEIDLRKISEEQVQEVETRANQVVFENREIRSYAVPEEKVEEVPLRKPPQKQGLIRVVEIAEFDYSACGGTHPRCTGEVGVIKTLKWDRIRDNVRFEFVCGERAFRDYTQKAKILRQLAQRLTASEQDVVSSVEKLAADLKAQKKANRSLRSQVLDYEAEEIIQNAEEKVVKNILTDKDPEDARYLALSLIKKGEFVVLYGLKLETRVHLILAATESLGIDLRELIPIVSPLIKGRGGGSSSLVELSGDKEADLDAAIERVHEVLIKML